MKPSMIWRSALREIKGSLGRFLAILAIVALGVGLFSGLKITRTDFYESMRKYYKEKSFYDYRILGELGFSENQVSYFANQADVKTAQGALSCDAIYSLDGGTQYVGRFHSLTTDVNEVTLVEGRMPEGPGECLLDSLSAGKGSIGKTLRLSDDNDEETLEQFSDKEYLVVGVVISSLYVQFERGNTSLGTGSVDAFVYLPGEAFTADYYTEVYVKFRQDFPLYSDEYDAFMKEKKKSWEGILEKAGHDRFLELPDVIADARKTLEEKRGEAEKELADAWEKLSEAKEKLEDGRKQLEDGKKELEKGKQDLETAKKELEDAKKLIAEKEPEIEEGREKIEKGQKEIADNEALIAEKETELTAAKTRLDAAKMALDLGEMQYKLTMEGLISEQKAIDASRETLREREKTLESRQALMAGLGLTESYEDEFQKEKEAIQKENETLDKKLKDLGNRYGETLKMGGQVEEGKKEYEANLKKYEEGEAALKAGKEALLKGKKELVSAQKKLEEGEDEIRSGKKKIADGEKEIEKGEKTLKEKEAELISAREEFAEGEKEYEDGLQEYLDGKVQVNDKLTKAENAIDEQAEKLKKGEDPKGWLLGRDVNVGYACFESDADIVDGIANVFPVFFFLVAALICMTTMNRMVEEQRTQIGVLKALGYGDGQIMFKFLFYSGSAAISGAILGYALGTKIFPFCIWTVYGIMYKAGPLSYSFDPLLAGISLAVSFACSVGTTYVSCRKELLGNAATLMRPRAPKTGKRVFLEYVPFLWKRLSFLRKVAVRNVMRYKKRFFMMVLGIGGCTGLLLTGFGLKDSIAGVAEMEFTEILLNDATVTLQGKVTEEFLTDLEKLREKGLGDYLVYQENAWDLVTRAGQKNVTVLTFPKELTQEEFSGYVRLKTPKGAAIQKPGKGEAVVTDKIAEMLGIAVGSEITLRDSGQREMKVKVTGIALNYIFNFVFVDEATYEEEWGRVYEPGSLYLKVAEGRKVTELAPRVMKLDGVANVSVTQNIVKRLGTMLQSMNLIVVLVTACAAGLAFIVLYNLTNINITERIREIATIKVLGFFSNETALYVFRENFVLTILGAVAGIFMGKWLHAFVIHEIKVDMVSFGVRIFSESYAYSILLTILFSLLVSLMMNHRLEEISMTESLKSVD